jgi:hypothetical protein
MFDPDKIDTAPAPQRVATSFRGLARRLADEQLARLLDDLRRWIEVLAEVDPDAEDHLGYRAAQAEAKAQFEAMFASAKSDSGSEQAQHARQRADRTLQQVDRLFSRLPRRATAFDYGRALTSAIREVEAYERAAIPARTARDLIAALADPIVLGPEPQPPLIVPLPDDDSPADEVHHGDAAATDTMDLPPLPPTLLDSDRRVAAETVHGLIAGTVAQIGQIVALIAQLLPGAAGDTSLPADAEAPDPARTTRLNIAIEVLRLRKANDLRHRSNIRDWMNALPPGRETPQGGDER